MERQEQIIPKKVLVIPLKFNDRTVGKTLKEYLSLRVLQLKFSFINNSSNGMRNSKTTKLAADRLV
jgi:hypothetical protein